MLIHELAERETLQGFAENGADTAEALRSFFQEHYSTPQPHIEYMDRVVDNMVQITSGYYFSLPRDKRASFLKCLANVFKVALAMKAWETRLTAVDATKQLSGKPLFFASLPEMIQPLESIQKGLQEIDAELPIRRVLLVEGASESNFAQTIQMNSTVMNFDFSVYVYSGKGGRDASVLESDSLRGMLKSAEFAELRRRLRTTTIPRLEALRREQESNHSYGEDPDHMSPFLDALSAFEKLFRQSRGLVKKIRHTRKRVREWISQREPADPDSRTPRELSRPGTSLPDTSSERSIFDDVDV